MLNKSCEKDLTPLLRSRDGREVCVACDSKASQIGSEAPRNVAAQDGDAVPPPRCFLPEVTQSQASRKEEKMEKPSKQNRLWEVLVQGPDLRFCCTRLEVGNQRPRLLADSFAVKVRLAAAVGVDTCSLQEAAAASCKMLMHKIMLPKLARGKTEMQSAKGQMSVLFDGKLIFSLPEEDCQEVPHIRVTPESLAGIIWEELGHTALKSLKQVPDRSDVSASVAAEVDSQPWWLEVSVMDGSGKETAMRRQLD
eukprot:Skav205592  [mRNA]  locus=scaffold460:119274:120029:+ [translate_table: standard]